MEMVMEKKSVAELVASSKKLVEEAKNFLMSEGRIVELDKYLTIKNYCKKYEIKDESVVTNWIRRGLVPAEDVHTFTELNGIRIIKDRAYR